MYLFSVLKKNCDPSNCDPFPFQDFGVTCVFTFMWLVSSSAWAKGLSDVKTATDPDKVLEMIPSCDLEGSTCKEVHDAKMSGLNTSVVSPSEHWSVLTPV